jgi:hypothetical protein
VRLCVCVCVCVCVYCIYIVCMCVCDLFLAFGQVTLALFRMHPCVCMYVACHSHHSYTTLYHTSQCGTHDPPTSHYTTPHCTTSHHTTLHFTTSHHTALPRRVRRQGLGHFHSIHLQYNGHAKIGWVCMSVSVLVCVKTS